MLKKAGAGPRRHGRVREIRLLSGFIPFIPFICGVPGGDRGGGRSGEEREGVVGALRMDGAGWMGGPFFFALRQIC